MPIIYIRLPPFKILLFYSPPYIAENWNYLLTKFINELYIIREEDYMARRRLPSSFLLWSKFAIKFSFCKLNVYCLFHLPSFSFAGHCWDPLSSYCGFDIHNYHISDDRVLLISLQGVLVLLCHVLHFDVFQLHGYDAHIVDTKLPTGCYYSISDICTDEFVFWIFDPSTGKLLLSKSIIILQNNASDVFNVFESCRKINIPFPKMTSLN